MGSHQKPEDRPGLMKEFLDSRVELGHSEAGEMKMKMKAARIQSVTVEIVASLEKQEWQVHGLSGG